MTADVPITVLYEPPRQPVTVRGAEGQWSDPLARYRNLAEALQRHTSGPVTLRTGFLRDAPPGVVLVRSSGYDEMMNEVAEAGTAVATRTILLDADRSNVFGLLERYGFAGAVEKHRFFEWRSDPSHDSGGGLHCRRELIGAVGGVCLDLESFQTEHYCVVRTDRYATLPALLVGYAQALDASGLV